MYGHQDIISADIFLASPAGEVASADCVEVGGVKLNPSNFLQNPSVSFADSSPTRAPTLNCIFCQIFTTVAPLRYLASRGGLGNYCKFITDPSVGFSPRWWKFESSNKQLIIFPATSLQNKSCGPFRHYTESGYSLFLPIYLSFSISASICTLFA